MKLSKYLIKIKKGTDTLLFSTISRGVILLTQEELEQLASGNYPKSLSQDDILILKRLDIVIEDDMDERNKVWVELTGDRIRPYTFSSYIALSTDCNFSCVYCYEKGQVDNIPKTAALADIDRMINWYARVIDEREYRRLHICLYGGEPLLHMDILSKFIYEIKKLSEEKHIEPPIFSMITNGYLLDLDKTSYLYFNGLKEVQITLDGDEKTHDSRRFLQNGDGTFSKIISNIKNLTAEYPNINVLIRISFDGTNFEQLSALLDRLVLEDLQNKIKIYFAPIHQTRQQKESECSFCSRASMCDEQIITSYKKLYEMAYEKGYQIPYYHSEGLCMMLGRDSMLLAPNGKLYKCVEMIGENEYCVGNVVDGYNNLYYEYLRGNNLEKCINSGCPYVALCGGGCERIKILENKDYCKKKYFDELIPFFLAKTT